MLKLNVKDSFLNFKDIRPEQLPEILEWYNNLKDFKYATGVDKPITMAGLIQRYEEVAICCSEFFVAVYENLSGKMVGILKGRVKDNKSNVLWISSLAIHPDMQGKGFGRSSLNLLFDYMKKTYDIKIVYISVVEDNTQGMKFWIKMSFSPVKRIKNNILMDGEKHNTIIMQKII